MPAPCGGTLAALTLAVSALPLTLTNDPGDTVRPDATTRSVRPDVPPPRA